ncbi:hypothetical protein HZS_7378, partial [Henneguya salminicola]
MKVTLQNFPHCTENQLVQLRKLHPPARSYRGHGYRVSHEHNNQRMGEKYYIQLDVSDPQINILIPALDRPAEIPEEIPGELISLQIMIQMKHIIFIEVDLLQSNIKEGKCHRIVMSWKGK